MNQFKVAEYLPTKPYRRPIVFVLDTGFRPELTYREEPNSNWLVAGMNWVDPGELPLDVDGHGTGILSILAASRPDIQGVDPFCRVCVHKVDGYGAFGRQSNWASAMRASCSQIAESADRGIILLASGSWGLSRDVLSAIDYAASLDILIVTIAHNDGFSTVRYPGKLASSRDNVICVGAVNQEANQLRFEIANKGSNYGSEVSVYFCGENVEALGIDGIVRRVSGTSAAGSSVAGIASLILQIAPNLSSAEVKACILSSSSLGGVLPDGGRANVLDIDKALSQAWEQSDAAGVIHD